MPSNMQSRHHNRLTTARLSTLGGFTLIESMVALLVLSVGLIGVAALHGQGLNASRTAVYRTAAINLSADMADRIRVNRLGGSAYGNAAANNSCGPGGGVDCTPSQMAAHDLFEWQARIGQQLPGGTGSVAVDATTTPTTYTISVTWDEVGQGQLTQTTSIQVPEF